ncbi:MAG: response regulator [Thermodesulfobacteriota bacterium]|nr:response regulator [Thermodesulfobacteriota bacterium]
MARILIVDDQACIREFLSDELIAEGYRVDTAADVGAVPGHMQFSPPDLVILDLFLDGPDGLEILRQIKDQYPGLPVIIFTAYDTYRKDPRISAADGYVIKSMFLGELKEKIAHHLGFHPRTNMVAEARPPMRNVAGVQGL